MTGEDDVEGQEAGRGSGVRRLVEMYERVSLPRRDLQMLLAVAAYEARNTNEPCVRIADTLIQAARGRTE